MKGLQMTELHDAEKQQNAAMHLALNVGDIQQSMRFYEDFFGVAPDKVRPDYARFNVANPPLVLSLNTEGEVKKGNRLSHLGIRVSSGNSLDAASERLKASGYTLKEELGVVCCHARQDKFWVKDPDGNSWEFYIVTDDMQEPSDVNTTSANTTPLAQGIAGDKPGTGSCCG